MLAEDDRGFRAGVLERADFENQILTCSAQEEPGSSTQLLVFESTVIHPGFFFLHPPW